MADFPEQPAVFIPNKRPISAKFALKDLEVENTRLKKLVVDISLDNSILKEAA